jgi:hypothetical protein
VKGSDKLQNIKPGPNAIKLFDTLFFFYHGKAFKSRTRTEAEEKAVLSVVKREIDFTLQFSLRIVL